MVGKYHDRDRESGIKSYDFQPSKLKPLLVRGHANKYFSDLRPVNTIRAKPIC